MLALKRQKDKANLTVQRRKLAVERQKLSHHLHIFQWLRLCSLSYRKNECFSRTYPCLAEARPHAGVGEGWVSPLAKKQSRGPLRFASRLIGVRPNRAHNHFSV